MTNSARAACLVALVVAAAALPAGMPLHAGPIVASTAHATAATPAAHATATAPVAREARWHRWDDGLAEASRTGRPVLVDVYTGWCGWCKRMDRDVYTSAKVLDYLDSNFVLVKLDAESGDAAHYEGRDVRMYDIATRFRVTGYPTTVFLHQDGSHLMNVPGYIAANRFVLVLRYVKEGHAERGVPFEEFEKTASR